MIDDRIKRAIEVKDGELSEELLSRVKENLSRRKDQTIQFDPFVDSLFGSSETVDAETRVRYAIGQADLWQSSVRVGVRLRAAQSLADRLLERVRRPFHELAVFYVELMAQRQKAFNAHVVSALKILLEVVQRQGDEARSREVAELKAEIERLREQIRRLEDTVERLTESSDEKTASGQ